MKFIKILFFIHLIFGVTTTGFSNCLTSFRHTKRKLRKEFLVQPLPFLVNDSLELIKTKYLGSALCNALTQMVPQIFNWVQIRALCRS
jgi:hypothetical protein